MNATFRPQLGQLPGFLTACTRRVHTGRRGPPKKGFQGPEGHGENIWVFSHRRSDQIIYSFTRQLDGFHGLKQLPFNGKKTKPAKLRRDYWSPLAKIQFQPGQGSVGRSVFQKLRELKHLHEVAWDDEFRRKRPEEFTADDKKKVKEESEKGNTYQPIRNKKERGLALNAQKKNAVADIAVVLAGEGRGNKMVTSEIEHGARELAEVTISWANNLDREYAESWSTNVTHTEFDEPTYVIELAKEEASAEPPKAA